MTDPLPADVRAYLENVGHGDKRAAIDARGLLARYPKPAPAWQPGDAFLFQGEVWVYPGGVFVYTHRNGTASGASTAALPVASMQDRIARGGRRVHPARFHDHAETLRKMANQQYPVTSEWTHEGYATLRAIADDIDPEVPDA